MMNDRKKVLVTGANGYLGRHVVQYLSQKNGVEVLALDISKETTLDCCSYIGLDVLNSVSENLYADLNSPDIIIHLAWQDGFNHNSEAHLKNLNAHYNFIKKMIDAGCASISIMGTMHEIGYFEGAINENTPCNPMSLYGIAKNALRQATFAYAENKNVFIKWLRAYYITGDDEKSKSIFGKILGFEKEGKATFPFTTGENKYDFIDVKELAKQISEASLQNNINGIINCSSGNPVSLKDKVEEFIKEKNLKIRPEYGVFPSRKYDSPCVYGDNTLIKEILGE